jgi:diguanylate cyclase (GGDEF)-like protein
VLAVIDLDYFKRINDTYGHMAGDRVLQAFARRAQRWLPDGALFGRLGGEEFGIYLPDCSEEDDSVRLEVLRADVEALEIAFLGNTIKLTTSIGLASVAEAGIDFDHLMAGADNALYMAKHEGRNRLKAFHPTLRIQKIVEAGKASRVSLSQKRVSRLSVRSHSNRR